MPGLLDSDATNGGYNKQIVLGCTNVYNNKN